ncbi:MAG: cytochrome c3 family protein, partial [Pseudomonadota bacterium]
AFHASAAHNADAVGISYANNMASPWVRHPTDFDMNTATGTEYADYGGNGVNAYVPQAPVASNALSLPKATVLQAPGDAIVTCISCHRAHGSDQPDLLRWNYDDMNAHGGASTAGCFACHTTKDA